MFRLMTDHHVDIRRVNCFACFGVKPGKCNHGIFVGAEFIVETDRWSVRKILGADQFVARWFRFVIGIFSIEIPFARFELVFHKGLFIIIFVAAAAAAVVIIISTSCCAGILARHSNRR